MMAFVRWRGHCAQLLATRYEQGQSRQICLANLSNWYAVPFDVRAEVTRRYPEFTIDWAEIDRVLAAGPPGARVLSPEQLTWLEVELQLRNWAEGPDVIPSDRQILQLAARILTRWRAEQPGGHDS